jgi:zinc protease
MSFLKKTTVFTVGLLLAIAMNSPMMGQATKTATAKSQSAPTIKYEKYKLKNGLEVIMSEDHRLPLVAVNLWYHVGPANEKPGRTGFAHLFEHMMFQGSKHVAPNEHFKLLEGAGASLINGTTSFDRTNYFETVPANQLELALWLESDRMGFLLDTLTARNLANQRDVVRNERREGENRPYDLVDEEVYHQIFPPGHPYYGSVIGSHADIESAHLQDVRDFFKQYYSPNNSTMVIVGDFDKAQAKQWVEKYFGPIPAGPPVPKIDVKTPPIAEQKRVTVTDKVELPRIYATWLSPSIFQPGDADADVLASILGGGKASRLYKKLVYEKQIAQTVFAQQDSELLGSLFQIVATAKPGVKPEDLEKAIDEELAGIQKDGPTAAEVDGARNTIESRIIRGLERLGGFGGVADRLNTYNHYLGDPGYLPKDIARYDAVTPASVRKLAQSFTRNSEVVVYGVPGPKVLHDVPKRTDTEVDTETASKSTDDDWRKQPPKPAKANPLTLPVANRFTLPNGLTVLQVEQHNLPVFAANLVVLKGSDANPADKPGLSSFTAAMLNEGTNKRPPLQLADDIDQIGAQLTTASTSDSSSVTVRALTKNADAAFDLLSDVALNPAFSDKEIERVRKTRLTAIAQQKDNPSTIANQVFYHEVYGSNHPYGYLELGTEASNKAISRDDMQSFYKGGYVPRNAALVVAGDFTGPQLRSLAEKYFGKWSGSAAARTAPVVNSQMRRNIIIVDKPGSPQTQLRVGQVGVPRSSPDFVPIEVMNTLLGGLFSSRINLNLREAHGYTYGAASRFIFRRGAGPFVVLGGIRTDATAPALKEVFNELGRMRDTQPTAEELSLAKDFWSRSLAGRFETTPQTADSIGEIFVYGLPADYYNTLPAKIDAVGAADVQRVAQKYLAPDSMLVVAVGDRQKIEPEIKKLDLGPMAQRNQDGTTPSPGGSQ